MRKKRNWKKGIAGFLTLAMTAQILGSAVPITVKAAESAVLAEETAETPGAVWLQNFEADGTAFETTSGSMNASVKAGEGCDGSKGLAYVRTDSSDPTASAGSVVIKSAEPVNTAGLRYLVFYIKDTQGSNTLKLSLIDADGNESNFGWTSLKTVKDEWLQYYVLLDGSITSGIDRTKITGMRIGQWNSGTYYIDNLYFGNYLSTGTPGSDNDFSDIKEGEVRPSVEPGEVGQGKALELIAADGAVVYYTTDGSEPTEDSKLEYKGIITITKNTTVKAIAVKNGVAGEIYTFEYEVVLPYVVKATSVPGTYVESAVVEFRTENGSDEIYYTTDGSDPVHGEQGSTKQYIKPMLITESTTFRAIAYNTAGAATKVTELEYIINPAEKPTVRFSKLAGIYGTAIDVELTANGDIYYTTDGSEPTTASAKYQSAIKVESDKTIRAIAVDGGKTSDVATAAYVIEKEDSPFLKTDGKVLKDNYGTGDVIMLRGTNAGGWLVTESWMCPTNAKDQLTAQTVLTERFGAEKAQELIDLYQDGWWTEEDFDIAKEEGMNILRLPMSYFEMLDADGNLKETAFNRLDWFVKNCEKRGLYVMIDMHGAVGSQNGKDHSGDTSIPDVGNFYGNEENIAKTIELWEAIAEKYKDNPWVCGYDLLNEPSAVGTEQFEVYDRIYKAVRAIDTNHVIYIQAIWEPTHLPDPDFYGWQNVVYQYHFYGWDVQTDPAGQMAFINSKVKMLEDTNYNVPLLVGEYTFFSNTDCWKAMDIFEEQQWSYTTWSYKVTGSGSSWGLYTSGNPKVNINSDTVEQICEKWSAENLNTSTGFLRNTKYADVMKAYFANNEKNKPGTTDAADIELTEKLTLKVGQTGELNAKVLPDTAAYKTLYYSSSNAAAAEVSADGVVTAKAEGTAEITVTNVYGMKKTASVTVEKADPAINNPDGSGNGNNNGNGNNDGNDNKDDTVKVESIKITGMSKKIAAGKKITLKAAVSPANAAQTAVTWKSGNSKYATVSSKGVVTTKKAGAGKTVKITAAAKDGSGIKASYSIKIVKDSVKKITLSTPKKTVKAGNSFTVKAKVTTTGKTANKAVSWSVNNTKYAAVSSKGKVTTKKAGKGKQITITAKATDGTGTSAKIKVKLK